jgi:hypothetical protein
MRIQTHSTLRDGPINKFFGYKNVKDDIIALPLIACFPWNFVGVYCVSDELLMVSTLKGYECNTRPIKSS